RVSAASWATGETVPSYVIVNSCLYLAFRPNGIASHSPSAMRSHAAICALVAPTLGGTGPHLRVVMRRSEQHSSTKSPRRPLGSSPRATVTTVATGTITPRVVSAAYRLLHERRADLRGRA